MTYHPTNEAAIERTIQPASAARDWQVLVVGAGPAGALAARQLALQGLQVLLVDKASFPRAKVCGGCLGRGAIQVLEDCGLSGILTEIGARPHRALRLYAGGRSAELNLPGGVAVSRYALDRVLVREAIEAGAQFVDRVSARLVESSDQLRHVTLRSERDAVQLRASLVLAADGLAGSLLAGDASLTSLVAPGSRIGLGATVEAPDKTYDGGIVSMVYSPHGYLGLVRVEDGRLNAAAAFAPDFVRELGGPSEAVAATLDEAGLPCPAAFARADWTGTPALTRQRRHLASHRLLVLGDAAGYVEPFTGEGMTWALLSAAACVPTATAAATDWQPEFVQEWERQHRRLVKKRQWMCRLVTSLLRRPKTSQLLVRVLSHAPALATPALRAVNRPLRLV